MFVMPTAAASLAARGARHRRRGRSARSRGRGRRPRPAWCRSRRGPRGCRSRRGCARRRTAARCARPRAARRRAALASTWRGLSGATSTRWCASGPRLSATMARKFGGCGPSVDVVSCTNSSSSSIAEQAAVRALEADRGGDLHVHARARRTASRRGGRARPRTRRAARAACRAASGRCRARPPPCRPRGRGARCRRRTACRRSSTAHGSGPRAVSISANAVCSGRWPGVCSARTSDAAELELPAVVERLVVVVGLGEAVDVDGRAGGGRQAAVAGDVVGVVVGLEDVLDRARPCSARARGTPRCRASGRPRRRRRRPRRRSGRRRSRDRRG